MNKNPTLVETVDLKLEDTWLALTSSILINDYAGAICNSSVLLIAQEWPARQKVKKLTIEIFRGFHDAFNLHAFSRGFNPDDPQRYRQATIVELLALGAHDKSWGLQKRGFVYALGSASIDPREKLSCGMIRPTTYYPGLESIDGQRQLVLRAIDLPWTLDVQVALVKL